MKIQKVCVLWLFWVAALATAAQNAKLDSLLNVLGGSVKEDTNHVNLLNKIAYEYTFFDFNEASDYANQAFALAEKLSFKHGICDAYNTNATVHYYQSEYDEASALFGKSLEMAETMGSVELIARANNNLGNVHLMKGDYEPAITYYLDALQAFEKTGHLEGMASALSNVAMIYDVLDEHETSLEYYREAMESFEQAGVQRGVAHCQANMGILLKNLKQYDQAEAILLSAIENWEVSGDPLGVANCKQTLGNLYSDLAAYDKALVNYDEAIRVYREHAYDTGLAMVLVNKASVHAKLEQYNIALENFNEGLGYAIETGARAAEKLAYQGLADLYASMGNYELAYRNHTYYANLKDSILNEENQQNILELEARYQNEKKKLEIEALKSADEAKAAQLLVQEEEAAHQRTIMIVFGVGFLLMLGLAIWIYKGYRDKKRDNLIIAEKKREVELQKQIVEEQHREITDSINYAKQIQAALLTKDNEWSKISAEHFIYFRPKDVVSGDFYWAYHDDQRDLSVWVTADCTGHGVPGAFMSMLGIGFLSDVVVEGGLAEPAEILTRLRERIIKALEQKNKDTQQKDGIDMTLCVWNRRTNELSFAGANNPLWIVRGSEIIELRPDKQPVGLYGERLDPFHAQTCQLMAGDALYTFSDGYADQFGGPRGKKFKYKAFKELLLSMNNTPMSGRAEVLGQAFDAWKGDLEQIDDICVVGVKVV